jgi:O-antigen ligase
VGTAILFPNADRLPWVVQRTISFLPVKIDPFVKRDAEASTEWRLDIWKQSLPLVPKYLFMGKGYGMNPNELSLEVTRGGVAITADAIAMTNDYHSGPLSIIIPLGVWGAIGFLWFLVAASLYLYRNYRRGDPQLKRINTFLWALFLLKAIYFFAIYGSFHTDFYAFIGIVGLSVSLNGRPEEVAEAEVTEPEQTALEAFS